MAKEQMQKAGGESLRKFAKRAISLVACASYLTIPESDPDHLKPIPLPADTVIAALGDSMTSGEGTGPFHEGTNQPGNFCRRSDNSYASQFATELGASLDNVACSGASVDDIIHGRYGEPSQLNILSDETDVVLLSAGGNVTNLQTLLDLCRGSDCNIDSPEFTEVIDRLSSEGYRQELVDLYIKIAEKAQNSQIFVMQYPEIIKPNSICGDIISQNADRAVFNFIHQLNQTIELAVTEAKQKDISIFMVPQPKNIDLCSSLGSSAVTKSDDRRSIGHPTRHGYQLMNRSLKEAAYAAQWQAHSSESS